MAEINITFKSLEKYEALLADLNAKGIPTSEADALIVKHSTLEKTLLEDSEPTQTTDIAFVEREIKEVMNQVYFGHRGRPYYHFLSNFNVDGEVILPIIFSYFLQLLEDKPEIIRSEPIEGLTEEQKLYGAFVSYADFRGVGYFVMNNHSDDSEIGRKIIHRIRNSRFTNTNHLMNAFSYAIGVETYSEVRAKYGNLTEDIINGPLKDDVIAKAIERYNVVDK